MGRKICAILVLLFTQSALAENVVVGGLNINHRFADIVLAGDKLDPRFTTLEWSLVYARDSFYVKAVYEETIKDEKELTPSSIDDPNGANQSLFFSRKDTVLTFGYSINDQVSVFAGYLSGTTTGFSLSNVVSQDFGGLGVQPALQNFELDFEEEGPFIGASYSHFLEGGGSLGFSVAYGSLDGSVRFKIGQTLLSTGQSFTADSPFPGDANGFSYSVSWAKPLTDSLTMGIALKVTRYEYDADPDPVTGDEFDFNDNSDILSVGLTMVF